MHITAMGWKDFMKLKEGAVSLHGTCWIVCGNNAAGKSAVLTLIDALLGGKKLLPDEPVRRGAKKAEGYLVIGEDDKPKYRVEMSVTVGGTYKLDITEYLDDGTPGVIPLKSPQGLLNGFSGSIGFDPTRFLTMDAAKQLQTLKDVLGLDFSAQDAERRRVYDQRAAINAQVKSLESQLGAMPMRHPNTPVKEVDAQEVLTQLQQATEQAGDIQQLIDGIKRQEYIVARHEARITQIDQEIAKLQEERAEIHGDIISATTEIATLKTKGRDLRAAVIDPAPLKEQLTDLQAINRRVQENLRRDELAGQLEQARQAGNALTEQMARIDEAKAAVMSAAPFPVPGLSFGDDGLLFHGIPFTQASSAEQLRVSVAMGLALNPKLPVLLIREGSLLDAESQQMVRDMADAAGAQVIMEVVGHPANASITIADGELTEVGP